MACSVSGAQTGAIPSPQQTDSLPAATTTAEPAPNTPATQTAPDQSSQGLSSHDEVTTFKVNVKLVEVRVVVRDSKGRAVGDQKSSEAHPSDEKAPLTPVAADKPVSVPERFAAYVFDDVHLKFADLMPVRDAAEYLQGIPKIVTMHLKDDTLEHKLPGRITLKTNYDVKPGSYLVRLVVRDAEGQFMSAESGAIEIP